jgi:hypothetical protein
LLDKKIGLIFFLLSRSSFSLNTELVVAQGFSFYTPSGFLLLLIRQLRGMIGVQNPPEIIKTGKGHFFFLPALFDNAYHLVRDTSPTAIYAKNIGFHKVPPAFTFKSPPAPPFTKGGD